MLNNQNYAGDRPQNNFSKYVLQREERLATSSRPPLFFIVFHKKRLGSKEKIKLTFCNPFSNYLILKRVSCMQFLFWAIYQN